MVGGWPAVAAVHLPLRGEVVGADDGEGLTQLSAHSRRRAEHEARDQVLDQILCSAQRGPTQQLSNAQWLVHFHRRNEPTRSTKAAWKLQIRVEGIH